MVKLEESVEKEAGSLKKPGLILLIIFILGSAGLLFLVSKRQVSGIKKGEMIGGERDEHGCLNTAGYTWCEEKQKCLRVWEEGCDEITTLLANIKEETGIDFTSLERRATFDWITGSEREEMVTVSGHSFEASRIPNEQCESIESYLKNQGFEVSLFNIGAGTVSGSTGYQKDSLVCLVIGGATGYKQAQGQWIPPEPEIKDVEVRCGRLPR